MKYILLLLISFQYIFIDDLLPSALGSSPKGVMRECNLTLISAETKQSNLQIRTSAADILLQYEDIWTYDDEHTGSYDVFFRNLLEHKDFAEWARIRKSQGKAVHVLDLFGSGIFLSPAATIDSITGVRLRRPTTHDPASSTIVEGNLFQWSTWNRLHTNLRQRQIPAIDLAVIRPIGGLWNLEEEPGYDFNFLILLRRAYRLMSADGEMFIQLPLYLRDKSFYQDWETILNYYGCEATIAPAGMFVDFAMKIVKNPACPELPPLLR